MLKHACVKPLRCFPCLLHCLLISKLQMWLICLCPRYFGNLSVVKYTDHYSKFGLTSCQKKLKNGMEKYNPEKQVAQENSERCLCHI